MGFMLHSAMTLSQGFGEFRHTCDCEFGSSELCAVCVIVYRPRAGVALRAPHCGVVVWGSELPQSITRVCTAHALVRSAPTPEVRVAFISLIWNGISAAQLKFPTF